jgi:O-antigen ligase
MGLLWTRQGLALWIAAFVVALAYATAAGLRASVNILPFLPAAVGIPICIRLALHSDQPRTPRLAYFWLVLAATFGFRSAMSDAGAAAVLWWVYYFLLLSLGLLLGSLLCHPRQRETVVRGLALGTVGVLTIALYSIASNDPKSFTQGRLTPLGVQANLWGPTGMVGLFHALLLARLSRRFVWRLVGNCLILLSILFLLLSFSRGAIFSCALAGVGVWLTGSRRVRGIAVGLGLGAAVAIMLLWGSNQGLLELSASERLESTYSESRAELMGRLWRTDVQEHPGFGLGFFQKEGACGLERGDPHNSYLLVLLEQGTFGLALLAVCLCVTFYDLAGAKRRWPSGSPERLILRHTTFALTALLLDALTIPDLWTHNALVGFDFSLRVGIVAGLVGCSSTRVLRSWREAESALRNGPRWVVRPSSADGLSAMRGARSARRPTGS